MITEDYVSFKTAKLLKEKGFDEQLCHFYTEEGLPVVYKTEKGVVWANNSKSEHAITQPTQQMAMKWLREVYKVIPIILTDENSQDSFYYWFRIDTIKEGKWEDAIYREDEKTFSTYEEAAEAAIKYCLENLI